jgi:DNA-binding NtrC family response regulator
MSASAQPMKVERHMEAAPPFCLLQREIGAASILGDSPTIRALRDAVLRVAALPARAVLIDGESGTGKGLVARAIHENGDRAEAPFVSITCSAMPEHLLESELFGHEPGAFTDARTRKIGLIEAAEGGALFLDEIGDMAPALQAKVLGFLEERTFRRVGGLREIKADVRVLSATHRDLRGLVRQGRFREDLYYRLCVVRIRVPPLRERASDVGILAARFADLWAAEAGRPAVRIAQAALRALAVRPWPGNVRELRNAVERAATFARSTEVALEDFETDVGCVPAASEGADLPPGGVSLDAVVDNYVRQALVRTNGNQCAAARLLRMSRERFRRRMLHAVLHSGPVSP